MFRRVWQIVHSNEIKPGFCEHWEQFELRPLCKHCKGRGICPHCKGEGLRKVVNLPDVSMDDPCPECDGLNACRCVDCDGEGIRLHT